MPTKVLLVDDSLTIRLLVRAYLVGRGYEFLETQDGREALGVIRRQTPDLVICDVFMPGMDGWDLVRALRSDARREVRQLPVILVSSKRGEDVARRSLEAGANAFLTKPVASERLVEVIDELLARGAAPTGEASGGGPVSRPRAVPSDEGPKSDGARGEGPVSQPTAPVSSGPVSQSTAPVSSAPSTRRRA
jgi:CheY-like chemotaxis protein